MIQKLREKLSGVIALALIILIAIPLAFFGVESIFLNSTRVTEVAEVNGEPITQLELERAVSLQQEQLMQILGENFDPAIFDSPVLRAQALQNLIDQAVIHTEAESSNMGVSEAFLGEQILAMQQFQVGGQFSELALRNYVAAMGFTFATFMEALERDITTNQLVQGVQASSLVTNSELAALLALTRESRSYEYVRLSVDEITDSVAVSEAEVASYYEQNQEQFQLPERVALDYVELDLTALMADVELDTVELQARVDAFVASQGQERRAAHILLDADDAAAKIAEIQQRLAGGSAFSELAGEYSVDFGSAASGGDLGFTNGSTFPPEFEAALAALEVGAVSDPVETDSGIHLIQLTEVSQNEIDLDAETAAIAYAMREERALDEYLRVFDTMQELAFSTDNLEQLREGLAGLVDLPVQTTDLFSRDSGIGIAQQAQVRSIAFSEIVLEDQLNSEVISLVNGERAVVVHLAERRPAQIQPLDEVRTSIAELIAQENAALLLVERAANLLEEARSGTNLETIARREDLEWQVSLAQTRANLDEVGSNVFELPLSAGLPVVEGFSLNSGDYIIARLSAVEPGRVEALSQAQLGSAELSFGQSIAALEWVAYAAALKNSADIEIKIDLPEDGSL